MSVDTIGDFLTIIRNGISASKLFVKAPHSIMRQQIATILKQEGFIRDFSVEQQEGKVHKTLKVTLKYVGGESVIHEIKRISTPGCRVYEGVSNVTPVIGGLGIAIMSTPRGVITNKAAQQETVGGEILCTVW